MKSYIVSIQDLQTHPNADRLGIAKIDGWSCVTGKDLFKIGDKALYIEVDSVLPLELEQRLLEGAKVKLSGGRVRAICLRGEVSQGLLVPISAVPEVSSFEVGQDCDEVLKIKKYEPPEAVEKTFARLPKKSKLNKLSVMPRYVDTIRYEKVPGLFAPDEPVHVTAKLHGTSVRIGKVPVLGRTWWTRLWYWFLVLIGRPVYEAVAGSRNVDCPSNSLYRDTMEVYDLDKNLANGEILFGEIVGYTKEGKAIQGNGYTYGCKRGESKLYAYAMMKDGKFLDFEDFHKRTTELGIFRVPLLFIGPFGEMAPIETYYKGRTEIESDIPCREGVVIASCKEQYNPRTGIRKIVKCINPEYLLDAKNSDEH